jgi:hypothetical protein
MSWVRPLLLASVLVTAGLAGCFGDDDPPDRFQASASGGAVADGWAHDGEGLVTGAASMGGIVDVAEDTGVVNITFDAWGSSWTITHDTFQQSAEFQDGGIARDVVEHGDSGQGHTLIPRVQGEVMTWGTAEVLRDREPYTIEQQGSWSAHIMFNENTVRGSDGQILAGDGSTPYSPDAPGDATIVEDDPQALLELTAPGGMDEAREPARINDTVTVSGPDSSEAFELPTDTYATATANVTAEGGEMGLGGGTIEVRIVDDNGTTLQSDEAQLAPGETYDNSFEVTDVDAPVTLELSGNGTYEATVDAIVEYGDRSHITVTWDDYQLDPA